MPSKLWTRFLLLQIWQNACCCLQLPTFYWSQGTHFFLFPIINHRVCFCQSILCSHSYCSLTKLWRWFSGRKLWVTLRFAVFSVNWFWKEPQIVTGGAHFCSVCISQGGSHRRPTLICFPYDLGLQSDLSGDQLIINRSQGSILYKFSLCKVFMKPLCPSI